MDSVSSAGSASPGRRFVNKYRKFIAARHTLFSIHWIGNQRFGFSARVELHAELKALREERAALEKAKKEAEIAQKAVQKECEEMHKEAEKTDQGVTKNNEKIKRNFRIV